MNKRNNITALRFNVSKKIGFGHFRRMQAISRLVGPHVFVVPQEGEKILLDSGIAKKDTLILDDKLDDWWRRIPGLTHIITDILHAGNKVDAVIEISKMSLDSSKVIVVDSMPPDNYIPSKGGEKPDLIVRPYHSSKENMNDDCQIKSLIGAQFAILDSKFFKARKSIKKSRTPRILVTCGASDSYGLSLKILKTLSPVPCAIDIIVGPLFNSTLCRNLINFSSSNDKITVHQNISDMIPFYQKATLVIGRPGLTRYEAAVLGCHGIYLWDSKGYENYFNGITKSGLADIYSSSQFGDEDSFFERLVRLAKGLDALPDKPNETAMSIVDGLGCERVVNEMWKL